ncbi:biotin/lipoate--protein ligase family protein [Aurantimonas marianensis]|uniref:Biotin/lipoate--protein ligase family protein n=1 Tax=Aurantimonas marianensis TaxID=2920428 RepID=A0A9X2H4X4_9HYPH|nr:biotin/lipoate--protein ligase family protein [Aurantimonas marianensis]MCP3054156.1 biotin/lipoate--protein ligase family protein [Aurantimonas marianensis]
MIAAPELRPLAVPEFPPVFTGHAVALDADPFAVAVKGVASGSYGAGDVVWSEDRGRATAAFVLEPETPLVVAAQMVPVMMVALGDALGAIGPPNLALTFRWPGTILANGGIVGTVAFHSSGNAEASDIPDHIVVAFELALDISARSRGEPGLDPNVTALFEEGCGELDRTSIIEAVARHFLSWIDGWMHDGFRDAHQSWLARANDLDKHIDLPFDNGARSGTMVGMDEDGGLLVQAEGQPVLVPLCTGLGVGA